MGWGWVASPTPEIEMQIAVVTSDAHLWAVRAFIWLFNKYWPGRPGSVPIHVVGFTPPSWDLPEGWEFISLGKGEDFPVQEWSTALIAYLQRLTASQVLLMLEDYWLCRRVDAWSIPVLAWWMKEKADVLRVDLTTDRLYAKGSVDVGSLAWLDIIQGDPAAEYHMSLQAAIWNRQRLLEILRPHETPWETELAGTQRLRERRDLLVIGTRQSPMRYVIGIRQGVVSTRGDWQFPPKALVQEDVVELERLGYLERVLA